jgi:tetratricopeptide (TPR) repeat protein
MGLAFGLVMSVNPALAVKRNKDVTLALKSFKAKDYKKSVMHFEKAFNSGQLSAIQKVIFLTVAVVAYKAAREYDKGIHQLDKVIPLVKKSCIKALLICFRAELYEAKPDYAHALKDYKWASRMCRAKSVQKRAVPAIKRIEKKMREKKS